MKSTGAVRAVDELGRIVIPIRTRRDLGINENDQIEILVDGEEVILQKYKDKCIFCKGEKDVLNYKGKSICKKCFLELKNYE